MPIDSRSGVNRPGQPFIRAQRFDPPTLTTYNIGLSDTVLAMGPDNGAGYVGNVGTATRTSGGTTMVVTVGAAGVPVGDTLLVAFTHTKGTATVTDSKGNVYAEDGISSSGTNSLSLFSTTLTTALVNGDTITATFPTTSQAALTVDEFTGMAAVPLDPKSVATNTQSNSGQSTPLTVGPTTTFDWPWDIAIGVFGVDNVVSNSIVFSAIAPFQAAGQAEAVSGAIHYGIFLEYRVLVSDASAQTPTANTTINQTNSWSLAAGYRGTSPHGKQPLTTRFLTGTALSMSDSLATTRQNQPSDTALVMSDSLASKRTRPLADTALVMSDALSVGHPVALADTALSIGDSLASLRRRPLSDTALSMSDSLATLRRRFLSDTALSVSDSLAPVTSRALTDTALGMSDALASKVMRPLSDTALSISDSIGTVRTRFLADTALTMSDSLTPATARALADTALNMSDSLASLRGRGLSDTALAMSDAITTSHTRALSDMVLVMSDSLSVGRILSLSDTALAMSDALASLRRRPLADVALTMTDALAISTARPLSDVALVVTDSIGPLVGRHLFDTALSITDALHSRGPFVLADTALTISDSISATTGGGAVQQPSGWSRHKQGRRKRKDPWWTRHQAEQARVVAAEAEAANARAQAIARAIAANEAIETAAQDDAEALLVLGIL